MATLIAVFSETKRRFFACTKLKINDIDRLRQLRASEYRYCVGDKYPYAPLEQEDLEGSKRLCWVRDRDFLDMERLQSAYEAGELDAADVRMGNTYSKRRREVEGRFIEVERFISKKLYEGIASNPEVLSNLSKDDFESLCAEVFIRRGFEVDLFRKSQDGGIDFLAVKGDDMDPLVFAVQCKQPDARDGKPRRSLGRPVLQQIYGAAKAWDLAGAVAISGSTYTSQAENFAKLKPNEMKVYDAQDVLSWIERYRWNDDE